MKQGKHWVQKRYFTEKDYRRFAKETIRRQKEIWNMSKKDFILLSVRMSECFCTWCTKQFSHFNDLLSYRQHGDDVAASWHW